MPNLLEIQYHEVKAARAVLLGYCNQLAQKDFLAESRHFGRGSIRNLLIHIGNTYEFWLGQQALQRDIHFTPFVNIQNVKEAEEYFRKVDFLVNEFIFTFADNYQKSLEVTINNQSHWATPIKLFTHVITHEFHHKGQILSLSRHLGYLPIDTDILR
jgi:uncharacterized damage-inducible protein DinB